MLVCAAVSALGRGLSGGRANCRPDPAPGPSVPSSAWLQPRNVHRTPARLSFCVAATSALAQQHLPAGVPR